MGWDRVMYGMVGCGVMQFCVVEGGEWWDGVARVG